MCMMICFTRTRRIISRTSVWLLSLSTIPFWILLLDMLYHTPNVFFGLGFFLHNSGTCFFYLCQKQVFFILFSFSININNLSFTAHYDIDIPECYFFLSFGMSIAPIQEFHFHVRMKLVMEE